MVNWHDPAVINKDYRAFPSYCINPMTPQQSYSRSDQVGSCPCRYLHVCPHSYAERLVHLLIYNNLSWETVLTAGFELDVLRGKRPYKWTIWVSRLYYGPMGYSHGLNRSSYTLERATQLYSLSSCISLIRMAAKFPAR